MSVFIYFTKLCSVTAELVFPSKSQLLLSGYSQLHLLQFLKHLGYFWHQIVPSICHVLCRHFLVFFPLCIFSSFILSHGFSTNNFHIFISVGFWLCYSFFKWSHRILSCVHINLVKHCNIFTVHLNIKRPYSILTQIKTNHYDSYSHAFSLSLFFMSLQFTCLFYVSYSLLVFAHI